MSVDERVILLESGFDARSRGVNGSRGRAASREARDKVTDYSPPRTSTSGRRPGVRAKRAARGVAGHQL